MKLSARPFLLIFCLACAVFTADAQAPLVKKQYFTQKLTASAIELDGIPQEPAWENVAWDGDFIQYQPDEGKAPAQQTQFKIIYDDKYLYLGFRCFDTATDSIVQRMGRRDEFPGDWVEVNIDSYHDLRTAFSFSLSVSGVKGDEFVSENGNDWDTSWNPVWYAETNIDSLGWTAEVKIPFSQLRYGKTEKPVWGIQFMRRLFRKQERSTWQYIPQNLGGWVSNFGELHGLEGVEPQRQVEIQPYVLAQAERFEKQPGNPFADGSEHRLTAGVDGKVAITSDLIVDFTVNPDFGQVEADPGAIRLDGYQIFFQERRPFFIESRNIFNYQITGSAAEGEYDSDLLFYSRRIGGAPHDSPQLADGEHVEVPEHTSILGAAKFSGKTKDGWSVGILESVTQREYAKIDNNGERREEVVEPLTNYFVGRLQKDFDKGNTVLGGIFTAVNRDNDLGFLHKNAYSGGVDFLHTWKNRTWQFKANGVFSRMEGSPEAILRTQTSFEHLFQRPNAGHVEVDSNRTSLGGHGGTLALAKYGGKEDRRNGIFKFQSGVTWRSPGLELNDIGFLLTADEINHFHWSGYQINKPFGIFNRWRLNYNHWFRWDFDGQLLWAAFNTNTHVGFKNNWGLGGGGTYNPHEISNNALRGGSSLRKPPGIGVWSYLESDPRKKLSLFANFNHAWGFDHTVRHSSFRVGAGLQLMDALRLSLAPNYNRGWRKQDQFVEQVSFSNETRTIVSEVEQRSFSLTFRMNYNLTPDLTVQYYGEPFIFRALYKNFGIVTDPLAKGYDERFHRFTGQEISEVSEGFLVDETEDGIVDYGFGKPDFNYIQFRSNLVVRWEYVAGSEVYFVWSQGSFPDAYNDLNSGLAHSLFDHVFEQKPDNIFLVKFTYRFLL